MPAHSYSGIKAFETCPRQYHETKILKLYPREETAATIYGTQLHEAAELFIKEGRSLPKEFAFLQPTLDSLAAMPGEKLPEYEMALTAAMQPCDFKDENYWVRGIADLVIVDRAKKTARIYDYKTGGDRYPDTDQLMLMALMLFEHEPDIESVTGALLFVVKGSLKKYKLHRKDKAEHWWKWKERVAKLDAAIYHNQWQAKASGLCRKYCPVITCEHNGRN